MPVWGWVLSVFIALAGLFVLLLSLFHVRYRAGWRGEWGGLHDDASLLPSEGFMILEFGFPGFMRAWEGTFPGVGSSVRRESGVGSREKESEASPASSKPSGIAKDVFQAPGAPPDSRLPTPDEQGTTSKGSSLTGEKPEDIHRWRRALFRLATDATAWGLVARYGLRVLRLAQSLLRPRLAMTAGHPDPVLLGRMAGWWYAAAPLLPRGGPALGFRFQDRRPSFGVRVEGGFSALSLLLFGAGLLAAFPWLGLGRRAWHGWRRHRLTGWRAWTYKRLQAF